MKCEMIPTNKEYYWEKTLTYFTNLYTILKTYSEDRDVESGFESAANITHIAPTISFGQASINLNRDGAICMP